MIFSDLQIKQAVAGGHIICEPYDASMVRGSSMDVHLGEFYYRVNQDQGHPRQRGPAFNPYDPKQVDAYFGDWLQAPLAWEVQSLLRNLSDAPVEGIRGGDRVIVLQAGERILAHTDEFVGILPPGTSEIVPRSTWARRGIMVECAGWGDPGFINRWTLEIWNLNPVSVVLKVGDRPAQMVFHETGRVGADYLKGGGQYQAHAWNEQTIINWTPSLMLPSSNGDAHLSYRHPSWEF